MGRHQRHARNLIRLYAQIAAKTDGATSAS